MIMVGDHITASMFAHAVESVAQKAAKKKEPIPALDAVRLETLEEGACVQTLHVGPFDDEGRCSTTSTTASFPRTVCRCEGVTTRST